MNEPGRTEPGRPEPSIGTYEPDRRAALLEERILILAPGGTDAQVISGAAADGGFTARIVADVASLCAAMAEGAGVVVLVEASFSPAEVEALRKALGSQPTWSDWPILLISADVERDQGRQRMLDLADMLEPFPVAFVERPLQKRMLISRLAAARRARRRQYENDLDRRRELAVLAALPGGVVVMDAAGRVIETNAAFQRIWGAMPVIRGPRDFGLFKAWPADSGRGQRPFEWRFSHVLATGQPAMQEELEIEAFDGAHRTILASALPIRGAGGEVAGVVGVHVDVTELARARRATRILSDATAALIASLDLSVTLHTLSRIIVTNIADCCAIYEPDERGELHRLVAETSGAASADEAASLLAFVPTTSGNSLATRVLRSGKPILLSDLPADWLATGPEAEEHRNAFEKIGVCSLMVLPLVARGRPLGVLGIVSTRPERRYDARDLALAEEVSRRAALALDNAHLHRQAETALRARSDALAEIDALLDGSPVGIALVDRDLRFLRINQSLARSKNLAADEVIGQAVEKLSSPEVEAQITPMIRGVLGTGQPLFDQMIVFEKPSGSGKTFHHLDSFVPVLDADGTPRAVGITMQDVTRLIEVEESLREDAVFRERFIGVLAHDLRSPLHAIVLSASALLRQGDAPPAWIPSLGRIAHAANRMERMVGNLLDLVRSREGGGIGVTRKPSDLADVVREVVSELEASHPGRHIAVSVEGDTHAELDPDRIAEVVSNLTGNALNYSPAESVVDVEVRGRDGELALTVHNAGAPIPPETQKTIFTPFKRGAAPGGGAPAMRGLGLGLFIVREITQAHGGAIAVSSTAEEGTTFTVRLPRTTATAVVAQHQ